MAQPEFSESYDYVIIGGGTAGCVLAGRLSEDPKVRVLMLEAGPEKESFWVGVPAGFTKLLSSPVHNWMLQTQPEPTTLNRVIALPKGKGIGGSTLINGMIVVRGQPGDYDNWRQRGCDGWDWDGVSPYFRKLENFEDNDGYAEASAEDKALRGHDGPFAVRRVSDRPEIAEAFIEAGMAAGYPRRDDYNGVSQEGFGYYQVNMRNGRRVSAADAYLKPARNRPNLRVIGGARVSRILLEGKVARGVEYRRGGVLSRVRAEGEVILAAGAFQSPQILELSGVGDPTLLQAAGVAPVHEAPGVGENYIDHYCTRMNWRVTRPVTLNEQTRGLNLVKAVAQYFTQRKGILTYATGLSFGFLKTRPELETPDIQLFFMHASYANAAERKLDRLPGMTVGVSQMRPQSRGSVHIASANIDDAPLIRPNFLSAEADRICMVEGMKATRRVMETPPMDPFRAKELTPGAEVANDEAWLHFARENGQTIYHACGTCRMGGDEASVVDPQLRLRGIDRLRVVDASIMPDIISGNIQTAVLMIAEKAADLIKAGR